MNEFMKKDKTAGETEREKSRAALSSVIWSGILTAAKIVAAVSSNSLGLLSEALHSALDLVAAGMTFVAVKISAVPADEKHPFGHGKVENLSALVETVLLFVTCGWIIKEAVERLVFDAVPVEPSWWVLGVVIFSLAVDINRSAMLRRVAKAHRSQALEADALHFTTDIWSSAVVLAGLACVLVSRFLEPDSLARNLLRQADAVAALGVAGIVLKVSWSMAGRAVTALLDGGSEDEARKVREALERHAPDFLFSRVRVRDGGAGYFVDVVAELPPGLRVDVAHEWTGELEEAVREVLPGADTTIHVEPARERSGEARHSACHRLAAQHGLEIHNLILRSMRDGLHVFVHIQLEGDMDLAEAHARVSAYERELSRDIGARRVTSHIEPKCGRDPEQADREHPFTAGVILDVLRDIMRGHPELCRCHDEEVLVAGKHTALSFRCRTRLPASVHSAHRLASLLEADIRARLPRLGWITIHVEPPEEDTPARGA